MPRPVYLTLSTLAAIAVCSTHAAVASANTIPASGVGYLILTIVLLCCAFAFWTRAHWVQGSLYIRWSLVASAAWAAAIGDTPSATIEAPGDDLMSDGREEREEQERRRELEKRKDQDDRIDRDLKDQWEPERDDS